MLDEIQKAKIVIEMKAIKSYSMLKTTVTSSRFDARRIVSRTEDYSSRRDKPPSLRVDSTQGESYREVKIRDLYQLKS